MEKRWLAGIFACVLAFGVVGGACKDKDGGDSTGNKSVAEIVASQAHEEKSGYKFCGYFQDKDFTQRVTKAFSRTPARYYAKYQVDKTQMFSYENGEHTSIDLDTVIYATDYTDAAMKYRTTLNCMERWSSLAAASDLSKTLGNGLTAIDVAQGGSNENRFFDFHDTTKISRGYLLGDGTSQEKTLKRDNHWKGYVGTTRTTSDGIEYYIVENYAVVLGYTNTRRVSNLEIPSRIEGKQVKEISILQSMTEESFSVGTMTIPSTVENVMIYLRNTEGVAPVDKIVFNEGVKTIRLGLSGKETLVFPSTAYYIDFYNLYPSYSQTPASQRYLPDQNITVAGDTHYYTKDGFLYSAEGDLVYQYANRGALNVEIDSKAKRVLRQSFTGIAKNITIPKNVEYFDAKFNEFTSRGSAVGSATKDNLQALFFISSTDVTEMIFERIVQGAEGGISFSNPFKFVKFQGTVNYSRILDRVARSRLTSAQIEEIEAQYEDLPIRIQGNVVYKHPLVAVTVGGRTQYQYKDEWVVYSYLNEDYSKSDLSFDSIVSEYFRNVG